MTPFAITLALTPLNLRPGSKSILAYVDSAKGRQILIFPSQWQRSKHDEKQFTRALFIFAVNSCLARIAIKPVPKFPLDLRDESFIGWGILVTVEQNGALFQSAHEIG